MDQKIVLITNDDGIDAEGIKALESSISDMFDHVYVIAPDINQSGSGHSIHMDEGCHNELKLEKRDNKKWSVKGYPCDCSVLGVKYRGIMPKKPDIVLSGINYGANVGLDMWYSGTVNAALDSAFYDVPIAIAFSQLFENGQNCKFHTAEYYIPKIIRYIVKNYDRVCMNVNFPNAEINEVKGVKFVEQGRYLSNSEIIKVRDDAVIREVSHKRDEDCTGDLYSGYITLTPVSSDITDYDILRKMQETNSDDVIK